MKRPQRLGARLWLSYVWVSIAAAVSGLATAYLTPTATYASLLRQLIRARAHPARSEALLQSAVNNAVAAHVALSLAVAIVIAALLAALVSGRIGEVLARVTQAASRIQAGQGVQVDAVSGIAELDELSESIQRLGASLAEARRQRDLGLASIAHELRTPLTTLRAYLEALRDGVLTLDEETAARLGRSIARLERMAADLRALGASEIATPSVVVEPVQVRLALAVAQEQVQEEFARQGVDLVCEAPQELWLLADPVRLGEILENLLHNSLAHSPAGSRVTVSARPGETTDWVRLTVCDEGEGIAAEDLPHLFEPFYRGARRGPGRTGRPGMGLGLAISRNLVRAMGGSISIESGGQGMGACVCVVLPRTAGHPTA